MKRVKVQVYEDLTDLVPNPDIKSVNEALEALKKKSLYIGLRLYKILDVMMDEGDSIFAVIEVADNDFKVV